MVPIQPIEHNGRVVALVLGDRALIDGARLPADALPVVQAKCLYALEIQARTLPGPYRERKATEFALNVIEDARRRLCETLGPASAGGRVRHRR